MTKPDRDELFTPDELAVRLDEWANCLDKSQWDLRSDMRCAAIHLRRLASSDGGVKVRELEWRADGIAQCVFGFYDVSGTGSGTYRITMPNCHLAPTVFPTIDSAKAAAQADYEARIKSALVEVTAVKGEPEPVAWPANLNPRTLDLVQRFALALAKKLRLAEEKYGHTDGWLRDDWEAECRDHLYQHLEKGDPRDVAAYCAFMWHHGWITYQPLFTAPPSDAGMREALAAITVDLISTADKDEDPFEWASVKQSFAALGVPLTAPGATTKSDGGLTPNATTIAAIEELKRGSGEIGSGYGEYTPVTVRGSTSDPSSTRSDRWVCAARRRGITLDPQDCDWPACGCDPLANKVLDTIAESGFVIVPKDGAPMTDDQIKHMVDRFLMWQLPENFNPDAGISYTRPNWPESWPGPVGTNLFDAVQATAMVRHMLDGLPSSTRSEVTVEECERVIVAWADSEELELTIRQVHSLARALLDQFEIRSRP